MRSRGVQTPVEEAHFLHSLQPAGWGGWKVESFQDYEPRARALLPNFPRDVLEDWVFRHYGDAVSDYGWIGLRGVRFEKCLWRTERILNEVRSWPGDDRTSGWTTQFRERVQFQKSDLGAYMLQHGTWPFPILVLDNSGSVKRPDGLALASPLHLMEGHHRYGYLRAMHDDGRWTPKEQHPVCLVRYDPKLVMDFWPLNYLTE